MQRLIRLRSTAAFLVACATLVVVTACASGDAARPGPPAGDDPISRALRFLDGALAEADAGAQALAGQLGARYGHESLRYWREPARRRLVERASDEPISQLANARIISPDATVPDRFFEELPRQNELEMIPWLVGAALHCDRPYFPSEAWATVSESLLTGAQSSGYAATHVALAIAIIDDLGCRLDNRTALEAEAVSQMTQALAIATSVDDITLEQIALLVELGHGDAIDPSWYERILDAQQPDGGFRASPDATESDWHATLLALWALSAKSQPEADASLLG